jgi:hypothetical protein
MYASHQVQTEITCVNHKSENGHRRFFQVCNTFAAMSSVHMRDAIPDPSDVQIERAIKHYGNV